MQNGKVTLQDGGTLREVHGLQDGEILMGIGIISIQMDIWLMTVGQEIIILNSSGAWTTDVPTSTSTNTSATQSTSNTNVTGDTVYVSSKGIYHKTASAHGMKNSTAMSRQEAIDSGYRACEAKHCP